MRQVALMLAGLVAYFVVAYRFGAAGVAVLIIFAGLWIIFEAIYGPLF